MCPRDTYAPHAQQESGRTEGRNDGIRTEGMTEGRTDKVKPICLPYGGHNNAQMFKFLARHLPCAFVLSHF